MHLSMVWFPSIYLVLVIAFCHCCCCCFAIFVFLVHIIIIGCRQLVRSWVHCIWAQTTFRSFTYTFRYSWIPFSNAARNSLLLFLCCSLSSCGCCSFHCEYFWCAQHNMIIGFIVIVIQVLNFLFLRFSRYLSQVFYGQRKGQRANEPESDRERERDENMILYLALFNFLFRLLFCFASVWRFCFDACRSLVLRSDSDYMYWQCKHLANSIAQRLCAILASLSLSFCSCLDFVFIFDICNYYSLLLSAAQHHFLDRFLLVRVCVYIQYCR